MKTTRRIMAWFVVSSLTTGSLGQVPPVAEPAGSPYEYFRLRDHKSAARLAPDVAAAIKSSAAMKAKLDDPLEGLGKNEVKKMADLAQSIRDVAGEKQLLR
ncbi:MAG: hypothetical protein L0Z62_01420 [Gemmataceae bacterium]|nr:hypothetical protein [Gemmataceae bacterium]